MEEFRVIMKAREFVREAGIDRVPVTLEQYAEAANASIKVRYDLSDSESGQTFPRGGKHIIMVNGNHSEERQRFTVLHELAHIVLELPSQHNGSDLSTTGLMSYQRRPKEEMLCDVFAAECLLPYDFFKNDVDDLDVSFSAIRELAGRYVASLHSTGSRFAVNCEVPCAFILMENGKVRYVSSSKHLRERKGWIDIGIPIPSGSVAARLCAGISGSDGYDELACDIWFNNGVTGYQVVSEEAVRVPEWDQCLSLLWFEDELQGQATGGYRDEGDDEPLLEDLDGVLPWPSKRR
jgi:Zn-dependent peptidase ImmA (M78 family)